MQSYWETQSFFHYDVIVIGSGITGLSTAISLKEKDPDLRIAVLERGIIPDGASLRNAGFACIGSFTEILDDLRQISEEKVLQLIQLRHEGLKLLRKRLGDNAVGYKENGSYELMMGNEIPLLDQLDKINSLLFPVLHGDAFSLCNEKIKKFGFDQNEVQAMILNHCEGALDTGKMMFALMQKVIRSGVEIKTGCKVESVDEQKNGVIISVKNTEEESVVRFFASSVAVCTNAFTKELLPDIDLQPGRGQVFITEIIPNLPFDGIFHFDKGYYYFREINGRVLFGGGRNTDFAGETTTDSALNESIQQILEDKLSSLILPGRKVRIEQRWAGIMAFGKDKFPVIKKYSDRIFMAVRMGGMGIAIGSKAGEMLAEMIGKQWE
ncbi:MAG: FAD-binding oxidoreductase [Chitinophagaceae bacterium]|nr:MAG: FAD-binding oxidoreductase [Chitinophagaceae bacterium]